MYGRRPFVWKKKFKYTFKEIKIRYFDQQIKNNNDDFGWGVVLSYKKQEDKKNPTEAPTITVDVILRVSEATAASKV